MDESIFLQSLVTAWDGEDSETENPYPDETPSASLNFLIRAARMFLDDRATPAGLFEELRIMTVRLEGALRRHPEAAAPLGEVREALLDIAGYYTDRDEERILRGIDRLKASWDALEAHGVDLDAAGGEDEPTPCPVCGQPNPPEAESCRRCGCLPPVRGAEEAFAGVPSEVLTLATAAEQVVAGGISLEEWQSMVATFLDGVLLARDSAAELLEAVAPVASEGLAELGQSLVASLDEAAAILEDLEAWDGSLESVGPGWSGLMPALTRARKAGEVFWDSAGALAPEPEEEPAL